MVFSRMLGKHVTPVYILSMGRAAMIPGKYRITPTASMVLFLMSREACVEFDIQKFPANQCVFRYGDKKQSDVFYAADGTWHVEQLRDEDGDGFVAEEDWTKDGGDIKQ